ncbi:uncharacterized protein LOC110019313 [Phalaenopsis equestris]|uniref:uncharacterized protein LOC110019313 n=1 Tax=Phalaenopsis equestris TaxID=78828 RepID=UPI0009E5CF6A|nr:uncharacterized protein LOC110019313 [Phalaenopsis equestris]
MATKGDVSVCRAGLGALSKRFSGRKKAQGGMLSSAKSDLSLQLSRKSNEVIRKLPQTSEVENAKCECCCMSEEFTKAYIKGVREKFSGHWICGLCCEAVKEEMEKMGGNKEEALHAHMSVCSKFNNIGRKQPVLYQAEAMREMLRRCSSRARDPNLTGDSTEKMNKGGIMRTSSCIAAITKETNGRLQVK